jgi:hypothetical protein
MNRTLLTWSLDPTPIDSPLWDLSTYRGRAIVRAKDEIQARQLAASYFRRRGGATNIISRIASPWYIQSLVACCMIEDPFQSESEAPSVLHPGVHGRMHQALA